MFARLLKSPAIARIGAWAIGSYLGFALRSTRWTLEGWEHFAPFAEKGPVIAAFWHETLPLMPAFWSKARAQNPARQAAVLVSRHRDGRFIGRIVGRFGVAIVHGSTASGAKDRGGAAGLRGLLTALGQGSAVVITPDGPRGPRRSAAPGATQLAALSGAKLLPLGARTRHRITLASWDRMVVPLPFGRGALVCLPPIEVAPDGTEFAHAALEAALTEATLRAATLCGAACPA
jgi:lysophospholipid acyltransferase (LPLAT)-like uncharacterized protein